MIEDKVDYFINQTNKRLESIEYKLDQLISFRVMLIGASIALSAFVTVIFNLALLWATNKG